MSETSDEEQISNRLGQRIGEADDLMRQKKRETRQEEREKEA